MARSNNGSISNYFSVSDAQWPDTNVPLSVSMWVRLGAVSVGSANILFYLLHSTANHILYLNVSTGGNVSAGSATTVANFATSSGGPTVSAATWTQVGGIWRSGSAWRNHYVNGVAGTPDTNTRALTTTGQYVHRILESNSADAEVADVTVWNTDIGADGMLQHAAGFSGRLIRPESIIFHAPFVRDKTEHAAGITITENGTMPITAHPPIKAAIAA